MLAAEDVIDSLSAVAASEPREARRLRNLSCLTRKWSSRGGVIRQHQCSEKADDTVRNIEQT
jgi:hypothetical protein